MLQHAGRLLSGLSSFALAWLLASSGANAQESDHYVLEGVTVTAGAEAAASARFDLSVVVAALEPTGAASFCNDGFGVVLGGSPLTAPLPVPNRSKPATLPKATPMMGTPAAGAVGLGAPVASASKSRPMPAFDESESESPSAAAPKFGLEELAKSNGRAVEEPDDAVEGDDDFAIGEVSRVVRLQDVVAAGARKAAAQPAKKPAAVGRGTAAVQAHLEATGQTTPLAEAAAASLTDDNGAASVGETSQSVLVPVAARPRRSHLTMMAAGGAALVLVIGLVVFLAASGDDEGGGNRIGGPGGDVEGLAISVDDPRYPVLTGKKDATPEPGRKPTGRRGGGGGTSGGGSQITNGTTTGPTNGKTEYVMGPNGPIEPLTPDDVITQALRMSTGTQRCYSRALKEDPFLKVKSIGALITISREGKVTEVSLDQMQTSSLGQCIVAAIKRWPFRQSTEGLNTKITLKFEQTIQ